MSASITIATPCYNESESLPPYFERIVGVRDQLTKAGWAVKHLLIDDGSRDNTAQLLDAYARQHPDTRVVRHPFNIGYGGAIKTAFALLNTDWLVFVDADTNYDQRLILQLVEKIGHDVDIINVSILAPGGSIGYPWYRLLLSSVASGVYHVLLPRMTRNIYTMTCGFRVYRRGVVEKIFPHHDDFVATSETMLRALQNRMRIVEYPASNSKREHGVSKMQVFRVGLRHLRLASKVWRARLGAPLNAREHLKRIGIPNG